MRALSISAAWDETKAIFARDGRLLASVALALIALPSAISGLVNPSGMADTNTPAWITAIAIVAALIGLAGQLAIIRLALGPSVTVGGAIGHGIRRLPVYFLAVLLLVIVLLIVAVPIGAVLAAMGVPLDTKTPPSGPLVIAALLYFALICFLGVRMILSAPVASAEAAGPIRILRRSWDLTAGNWWRLFGFVVLFFIGAIVVLIAIGSAVGAVLQLMFGGIDPLSVSALILALVEAFLNAVLTTVFGVMLARIYVQLTGTAEAQPTVPSSGT
jgi:Membrane domain of glycerophosphoryl diester phosphodiesterase